MHSYKGKGNDLINPDEQATNSRAAVEQAN